MKNTRVGPRGKHSREIVTGVAASLLGLLVISVAAVEYYVFADVLDSGVGSDRTVLFGMTAGTSAYVLGYALAGVVLLALGAWKIHRARRGE